MKDILIYVPDQVIPMSTALIKDLCWIATHYAAIHAASSTANNADNNKQPALAESPGDHVKLVSRDGKPVNTFSGNQFAVDLSLADVHSVDAIFLCAFWGEAKSELKHNPELMAWLRDAHAQGTAIIGVSNGPCFMAEAGLLDGKVATVYPVSVDSFRQHYPKVNLSPERAITDAGNLYCANGIASGCDLIVAVIEKLYGSEVARKISREFLLGFERSYSLINIAFDGQKYHQDKKVLEAQQWLECHYSEEIKLESVAEQLGMSPRNFSRRFKAAAGSSPREYLLIVRIEAAKELLQTTRLSVSEVAYRVGYSDLSYFSRIFQRSEGCMPHVFREEIK